MHAALTEPLVAAAAPAAPAPTPRDVAAWTRSSEALRFFAGGRDLGALHIPALTLNVPFTRLSTNLDDAAPPWETLPAGVEAAVVPAQPVEYDTPRIVLLPGMVRYTGPLATRHLVDLRGTFADYLRKFKGKHRSELGRTVRKLAELSGGRVDWREFRSPDEMAGFYRLADEVSKKSWGAEVGGRGFAGTLREADLRSLAGLGLARGYVLFHAEQPVAYIYCSAHGELLYPDHIGYSREYAKWSPGSVSLYLLLEGLFAKRRYHYLDLGEGILWYKSFFATHSIPCVRVIYFRRTLRNLAIVSAHHALSVTFFAAGKLLARIGLKQAIKRTVMGKLRRPGQEE